MTTSIGEVGRGRVELLPGDYDEYVEWKRRRAAEAEATAAAALEPLASSVQAEERSGDGRRRARRREAEERNRQYRERRAAEVRLAPVEARIAELEKRILELQEHQADPEVYRDPERAGEIGREKSEAESRLAAAYAEWESIAEELPPGDRKR